MRSDRRTSGPKKGKMLGVASTSQSCSKQPIRSHAVHVQSRLGAETRVNTVVRSGQVCFFRYLRCHGLGNLGRTVDRVVVVKVKVIRAPGMMAATGRPAGRSTGCSGN